MKRFIILSLGVLLLVSCHGNMAGMRDAALRSLLPGECLVGTDLVAHSVGYREQEKDISFSFGLHLENHELVDRSSHPLSYDKDDLPTDALYDTFGANKTKVHESYITAFESFFSKSHDSYFGRSPYTTILYTGDFTLTADKDFAGIPAGTNLAHLAHPANGESGPVLSSYLSSKGEAGAFLSFPYDYICLLETNIHFVIPVENHTVTRENVTFHLEVPVKVIMFLQWLNDQIDNPNAEPPYYDTVLKATFTSSIGLN